MFAGVEGWGEGGLTALGRIDVGVCHTRGARSRRSCGLWGRRGRWGGGGSELKQRHGWLQKDNEVIGDIKCVEKCFLLRQILMLVGAFEQKRERRKIRKILSLLPCFPRSFTSFELMV